MSVELTFAAFRGGPGNLAEARLSLSSLFAIDR
jgi:hypothetical protein